MHAETGTMQTQGPGFGAAITRQIAEMDARAAEQNARLDAALGEYMQTLATLETEQAGHQDWAVAHPLWNADMQAMTGMRYTR